MKVDDATPRPLAKLGDPPGLIDVRHASEGPD